MKTRIWLLALVFVVVVGISLSVVLTQDRRKKQNDNAKSSGSGGIGDSHTTTLVSSTNLTLPANGSAIVLSKSNEDTLITLVLLAADGQSFRPVGRSYNGKDWETSAGPFAGMAIFECDDDDDDDTCSGSLPEIPLAESQAGSVYQLTTFSEPNYSDRDCIARFLEQATFGPTLSDIQSLMDSVPGDSLSKTATTTATTMAMARWIKHQQTEVPIWSHRAMFRRHLNARFPIPNPIGPVTTPCMAGSRYRLQSFSVKDIGRILTIQTLNNDEFDDDRKRALLLDDKLRTVVGQDIYVVDEQGNIELANWEDGDYNICFVVDFLAEEGPFPLLLVDHPEYGNCLAVLFQTPDASDFQSNPYVDLVLDDPNMLGSVISQPVVMIIAPDDATPIDLVYKEGYDPIEQDIILQNSLDGCHGMDSTDEVPVFVRWNDRLYIHDPRFVLLDNDVSNPLVDGGGQTAKSFANPYRPDFSAMCANVPRTFLNQDRCYLSDSPVACAYASGVEVEEGRQNLPDAPFEVNHDSLRAIYEVTGGGEPGTVYVYAIGNLDIARDPEEMPPCQPGSKSRWVPRPCTGEGPSISFATDLLMANIISRLKEEKGNENILDIFHPQNLDFSCDEGDTEAIGFEVKDLNDADLCWKNVHSDHLKVFDFTSWTTGHPGNSGNRNPITEVAIAGNSTLLFPAWHEMARWNNNKMSFGGGDVSLGDTIDFYDLPDSLISEELASSLGIDLVIDNGGFIGDSQGDSMSRDATIVCGSPFEVANHPTLGGSQGEGAFDAFTLLYQTTFEPLTRQRDIVWAEAILKDPGQLRQRVAWALSQIIVVSPGAIADSEFITEAFVSFYDIFIRNAFGNYRDLLKEVAYSPMMADMLTYHASRSTTNVWQEEQELQYPDENFAREVMQLFSVGLFPLNQDGTKRNDFNGVYTNDDIEEYARAWTGFVQQARRGNIEGVFQNRIDPMRVVEVWRDPFPKMGLDGKYVGDGFPLCSDLPSKHFLTKGAIYRLLGREPRPETQRYPVEWLDPTTNVIHLSLSPESNLYMNLCKLSSTGDCEFPMSIRLAETVECHGVECQIDTIRVVEVGNLYYEYIRPACVHRAFFHDSTTIVQKSSGTRMCGDTLEELASTACCGITEFWDDFFWGERTKFATSNERCGENLCTQESSPGCDEEEHGTRCYDNGHYWTMEECQLKVKINDAGKVAIVHTPSQAEMSEVESAVREDATHTFFRVHWQGNVQELLSTCNFVDTCMKTPDGFCVCNISVEEYQVFSTVPSAKEVKDKLNIGTVAPDSEPDLDGDVKVFGLRVDGTFARSTIFGFRDDFGIQRYRKNTKSVVFIDGTSLQFRNPPHFMSLAARDVGEAYLETEAVLDSYLFHPNTGPFLAIRLAQRFGISNPTPSFIKAVSEAFQSGTYSYTDGEENLSFGSGEYGDLAALLAAILLDDESRAVILDTDPTHGAFKEPLLKITGLLRSLQLELDPSIPWIEFSNNFVDATGQMAHAAPSVFSFFLPEYQPSGRIAQSSLVAPEAQVLTGPRLVDTLNGIYSLIKYGHTHCFGGFAPHEESLETIEFECDRLTLGSSEESHGTLTYRPSDDSLPSDVVDELAALMTAGRLNNPARQLIEKVYASESDPNIALIKAQLLMASSPEFHITNLMQPKDQKRKAKPPATPSSRPYKAVVNIQLPGGVDSFNLLAPHSCTLKSNGQTVLQQYNNERTTIAFSDDERTRIIDAEGQSCEQFVVHPDLSIVEKLFNEGSLAFFANIGQLDAPVTKDDYISETRTELFAHNTMQRISQRIDPFEAAAGTGILGRMSDVLIDQGFKAQPISIAEATVATAGSANTESGAPLIVSSRGLSEFAPRPQGETFDIKEYLPLLNNATDVHSSIFGETWSDRLQAAVGNAEELSNAISNVELSQSYPLDAGLYVRKMEVLSSVILTHKQRGADRDLFWLSLGDWDHHENLKLSLAAELQILNEALTFLEQELKAQNYYENVTVVITSDFGRTLTANSGTGSDHAWGGNLFMFGGAVDGGTIHGQYPNDITTSGPLNIGRGRLIPTLSWESMFNGVAQWMGVEAEEDLNFCMPNRKNTGTKLFSQRELFRSNPELFRSLRGVADVAK